MKSSGICSSQLMVVLLVTLLTIVVVYIGMNMFNKEQFFGGNLNNSFPPGHALFHSSLLNSDLQQKISNLNALNPSAADNSTLSARHLKQVYETRRPELIKRNPRSPDKLCYMDFKE